MGRNGRPWEADGAVMPLVIDQVVRLDEIRVGERYGLVCDETMEDGQIRQITVMVKVDQLWFEGSEDWGTYMVVEGWLYTELAETYSAWVEDDGDFFVKSPLTYNRKVIFSCNVGEDGDEADHIDYQMVLRRIDVPRLQPFVPPDPSVGTLGPDMNLRRN